MNKSIVIAILSFVLISSCIDPLETEVEFSGAKLVVNAEIHDLEEPNYIYLSRSSKFNKENNPTVSNAYVAVEDSLGNRYEFMESEPGVYKICPVDFVGQIGMSYKLIINDSDNIYETELVKMKPKGEIVDFFFEKDTQLTEVDDSFRPISGLNFYIDFEDKEGKDYYKIDYKGTYKFKASNFDQFHDYCFRNESSEYIVLLHNDRFTNNSIIKRERIVFLEKGFRFKDGYSIRVNLKALNEDAYNYWRLIADQTNSDGSVFSALPSQIKSNIQAVNSENEVLGFFTVTSIATRRIYVPTTTYGDIISILPGCTPFRPWDPIQDYCYDCTLYFDSSGEVPDFWPENGQ